MQLSHRLGPFMATDSMIIQGDVDEDAYRSAISGPFDVCDAMHALAALRATDAHYGVQRDDDRAVFRGMYLSMSLLPYVRIVSPAKLVKYDEMQADDAEVEVELTQQQEDEFEALLTQWFEVCFDKEGLEEYGIVYPQSLKGKTITIRALTEKEADELGASFATVRADGKPIEIPGISRHQF